MVYFMKWVWSGIQKYGVTALGTLEVLIASAASVPLLVQYNNSPFDVGSAVSTIHAQCRDLSSTLVPVLKVL